MVLNNYLVTVKSRTCNEKKLVNEKYFIVMYDRLFSFKNRVFFLEILTFSFNVAFDVIIAHLDRKLDPVFNVGHTTVWIVFCINFSIENFVGSNSCDHFGSSAINSNIVARA